MIDIAGIDKAELLAALHNNTRAVGMGRLHDLGRDITVEEVRAEIGNPPNLNNLHFDYYHGRPLKVSLAGDSVDEWLYDRDAGQGAFRRLSTI